MVGKVFTHWSEVDPDAAMLAALDFADATERRAALIEDGDIHGKRNWSNRFADACARMVADAVAQHRFTKDLTVRPDGSGSGSAEPPTIVMWDKGEKKRKKVDVVVGDLVAGLQVAISLKGAAFRDAKGLQYGKNLTGRLYELENETRNLHSYRPQAIVVAIYFLPLASVSDKRSEASPSTFAQLVAKLRGRTGRLDPRNQDEWHRVDLSFIALYASGDPERFTDPRSGEALTYDDRFPRGVVRYFNVMQDPPMRGRPMCETTISLADVVQRIADKHTGSDDERQIRWAMAEPDVPYDSTEVYPPPPER